MIPAPNFIAGLLIGIANESWLAVLIACSIWPFIFCGYVSIADSARKEATVAHMRSHARRLLWGSPVLTFYAMEFGTAFMTSLVIGFVSHFIKRLIV